MSPTTSGRRAPRVTARVRKSISSTVTGTVESWPSTTIAAVSPTRISSTPARVGEPAAGRVVGGDHHDLVAAALHLERARAAASLPGAGVPGAGCGDGSSSLLSFQGDVVDQAGAADADGGGEDGRVERRRPRRSRPRAPSRSSRARAGSRVASARGRASAAAAPRARAGRCATRARGRRRRARSAATRISSVEVQVAHHPADDRDLLGVLLAEVRAARPDDVEELEADRRDAAEVAGPVRRPRAPSELLRRRPTSANPGG